MNCFRAETRHTKASGSSDSGRGSGRMKVLRWERGCGVGWAARALETLGGEQERGWRREGALKGRLVVLATFP